MSTVQRKEYPAGRSNSQKGHGGDIPGFSERFGISPDAVCDYSTNINPLGVPPVVRDAVVKGISSLDTYPDASYTELCRALGAYYNASPGNILCGNGSSELIYAAVSALPINHAVIIEPNFSEYRRALTAHGVQYSALYGEARNGFKVPVEQIAAAASGYDCIFLSNPNNPSGYLYTPVELEFCMREAERCNTLLVIDEAFIDFVDIDASSVLTTAASYRTVIVLRSLTKIFALAGVRLGFCVAESGITEAIAACLPPWNVNSIAVSVGRSIAQCTPFFTESRRFIRSARQRMVGLLSQIDGLKVYDSVANFLLCRLENGCDSDKLQEYLGASGIMIRDASNYPGLSKKYFRVTIKGGDTDRHLVDTIEAFCTQKG